MTTATITPEQHLTVVKHLASGKGLDVVATMTHLDRSIVLDIGSKHGYPDTEKLSWAVDVLTKNLDEAAAPTAHPDPASFAAPSRPAAVASTPAAMGHPTRPDEIRALINTAKSHPSKRIQNAGDRLIDAIDRLKTLIRDDQERHAKARQEAEQRAAAKAEVARLEQQLRQAKAKLKSQQQRPGGNAAAASGQLAAAPAGALVTTDALAELGVTSKDVRRWAQGNEVDCPNTGRLPTRVLDAYRAAHADRAASS